MSRRKKDPDVKVLEAAARALLASTSANTLKLNLDFLRDFFITNPPASVREKFWKDRP